MSGNRRQLEESLERACRRLRPWRLVRYEDGLPIKTHLAFKTRGAATRHAQMLSNAVGKRYEVIFDG